MSEDLSRLTAQWPFPTDVRFGIGQIANLGKICGRAGMSRLLLVTDAGLAENAIVTNAMDILGDAKLTPAKFSDVKSNPTAANVAAGVAAYRAGDHDGIVAMGGGSAMDAAKGIAFQLGQSGDLLDYAVGGPKYREMSAAGIAPIIAIPTTSGTGSEVGRAAVISDEGAAVKRILYHPALMAKTVICDPELVVGLPGNLTAWTGLDAAVHCLEAYSATLYNPMCDGIAAEGLRLIQKWLPEAVRYGGNIEARAHMMAAAAMAAAAFAKGLGAVHAISHAIGARYDTHHGLTNAAVLPYVLEFNRPAIEDKVGPLAGYMGLPHGHYDGLMIWVLGVRRAFEVPHTLAELGVQENDLDALAETAAQDITARENPVPVDAAALRGILEKAMAGQVEKS
ncbi:MAG: iron-containing alcohol dehydrogenase [Rhodospirillaceae bacterium]